MSTIYLNNMLTKINTQFKWTLLGLSIGLVFLLISLRDIDVQAVYDSLLTIKFSPLQWLLWRGCCLC